MVGQKGMNMRKLLIALAVSGASVVPGAIMFAGTASAAATGANQYGTGFPISSSGYCHGAFANTNGNFGGLGGAAGGGVPVYGSTGWNNSAVSGDCTLPSGH